MNQAHLHQSSITYRPDIDGLRAVAVLSVLACHTEINRMAGGFIGVDVFFVISGYLISSIIFSQIAASTFSIVSFYERRIRRIFPALFGMLLVFTIFAMIYFLPIELVNYSKSLLAATVSSSNFYFWQHSGYFDSPTSNPLLHTWSLAVEEQFYILFPIFLLLIRRFFPNRLRTAVVVLFVLSLITSAIVVHFSQNTAFYMPYTRAWELLLGTILSLKMFPPMASLWLRNLATAVGAVMIAYSVLSYSSSTTFPGLSALVPCIGTALIIQAGESGSSIIGALLSWRPVVFIGLISYSLYLWHWPFIILHDMGIIPLASFLPLQYATHRYDKVIEILASFLLAILSWRFVERPFRDGPLRLTGRPLFALAGTVVLVFVSFSSLAIFAGGFKGRFSPDCVQLESYLDNKSDTKLARLGTCFIGPESRFEDYSSDLCLHLATDKPNYLLLGDSHSAMLWPGLSSDVPSVNVMQASASGCAPFVHPDGDLNCRKMMTFIFQSYLPSHSIRGLLLEKRWRPQDLAELTATFEWAREHQVRVILFGPVPEYDTPLPRLEAYSIAWNQPNLATKHRVDGIEALDKQLQTLASAWQVPYASIYQAICSQGNCAEYADSEHKVPLMFDKDHLSTAGSLLVVHRMIERGDLPLGENRRTK